MRSIYSANTSWGKMRGYTGRRPITLCADRAGCLAGGAGCPGLQGGVGCPRHGDGCPGCRGSGFCSLCKWSRISGRGAGCPSRSGRMSGAWSFPAVELLLLVESPGAGCPGPVDVLRFLSSCTFVRVLEDLSMISSISMIVSSVPEHM